MASLYYEFNDSIVNHGFKPSKYCVESGLSASESLYIRRSMFMADRAWLENSDGIVECVKNRLSDSKIVNLEEFFWIKLQSVAIDASSF